MADIGRCLYPAVVRNARAFKHPSVFALFAQSKEVYDANGVVIGISGIPQPRYQAQCPPCANKRGERHCIHDSSLGPGTYCKLKLRPRCPQCFLQYGVRYRNKAKFCYHPVPYDKLVLYDMQFCRKFKHEIAGIRSVADLLRGWFRDRSHANAATSRLASAEVLGVPRAVVLA